ncbi:hypothetical protein AHIS1636_03050 [Arthrobacter mangrovi]|uniref:Uncharacterized protein n=1 Tax=Arthrobacter mangrovi TaxID=2966350 RepID=A0ABQ5MPI8_9MICC|nr:hypothetical protein AHIS1636_03050 [Arthrobacter mangrovi]
MVAPVGLGLDTVIVIRALHPLFVVPWRKSTDQGGQRDQKGGGVGSAKGSGGGSGGGWTPRRIQVPSG